MDLSQLISVFVVCGAVYLMMFAGLAKRALEPKNTPRLCPSCGRRTHDCRCHR